MNAWHFHLYKTKSQRTGERHELHLQETEQPRQVSSIAKDDPSMLSVPHLMEHMVIPVKCKRMILWSMVTHWLYACWSLVI